tara:strand:- start:31 stop:576 length:546 start_codon:yes stop_codon:yes gene_type:complete
MYYIYHIPNVKIGCSTNPHSRVKDQGYSDYDILEEHTCIDTVSKRELELQKEYGYKVDSKLYSDVVKMPTKESCSKGGKLGGNKHSELRNSKCSELGKRTWKENFKDNISKRRCYRGNNNPFSKITEKKAQQILDDYTKLVNNGHKTYGLYPAVYKLHQDTTLKTVKNICRRSCWKHLKPN